MQVRRRLLVWGGNVAEEQVWTVKATLDWCEGYLQRHGDSNPRLSAQWLLSEATGLSRIQLYANFQQPLSLEERAVLRDFVARRGKGEPLQYITGQVGFRYIMVKVRPGVLIPRPETEVLVSEALSLLPPAPRRVAGDSLLNEYEGAALMMAQPDQQGPARAALAGEGGAAGDGTTDAPLLVADICTGSGCIACAMASEREDVRVIAGDIAEEAVALARENVADLGLGDRVQVVKGDLGEAVEKGSPESWGNLDLVVSNPPYVPTQVMRQMPAEVTRFEPALALDGGEDGLGIFRRLLVVCSQALKPGGAFAFELHEDCLDTAADEARKAGFSAVRVVYDLAGRPRVLTGRRA